MCFTLLRSRNHASRSNNSVHRAASASSVRISIPLLLQSSSSRDGAAAASPHTSAVCAFPYVIPYPMVLWHCSALCAHSPTRLRRLPAIYTQMPPGSGTVQLRLARKRYNFLSTCVLVAAVCTSLYAADPHTTSVATANAAKKYITAHLQKALSSFLRLTVPPISSVGA